MAARLTAIQRHLVPPPFSTEKSPTVSHYKPLIPLRLLLLPLHNFLLLLPLLQFHTQNQIQTQIQDSTATMSSQPSHPTLLIPGPIEFDDAVLQSMGHYA